MVPDWLQCAALFATLAGIVLWIMVAKQLGSMRYVMVPLFWLIIVALFSIERIFFPHLFTDIETNSISMAIRVYGIITLVWMAVIILRSNFTWKR